MQDERNKKGTVNSAFNFIEHADGNRAINLGTQQIWLLELARRSFRGCTHFNRKHRTWLYLLQYLRTTLD